MRKLVPLLILSLLFLAPTPGVLAQTDCNAVGDVSFICGPENAEDLVQIPDTDWIISSAMGPGRAFYLVDSRTGSWSSPSYRIEHDTSRYALCPSAPDIDHLETHGLNIRTNGGDQSTLYSVGHGAREAIEIFTVDTSDKIPTITWIGCVPMPDGLPANSVASFADGSLVATILLMPDKTFADSIAMRPTGYVVKWTPGDDGFTFVENTQLPGNNGIEVSADASEIYVVSSGFQTIVAFSNTNPARLLRSTEQFPITPDNVHLGKDGRLLTAGMKNDVPECGGPPGPNHDLATLGTCPRGTIAIAVDPATMAHEVLVETPALPAFSNATMVLLTGDQWWAGTFNGDRIAHGELP